MIRKVNQCEISTFNILAIGRLLWETLYLPFPFGDQTMILTYAVHKRWKFIRKKVLRERVRKKSFWPRKKTRPCPRKKERKRDLDQEKKKRK